MGVFNKLCRKGKEEPTRELEPEDINPNNTREDGGGRIQWASPTEFLLTCIGYSVGLGNVWRFPYLCYKSGGGAFLIPYMLMIALIGMPLLFMEYGFGQYFGIGSLTIYKKFCPLFQGIGIGYTVLNALVCIYYNVIIALALYYLFASFTSRLPWSHCENEWNTPACGDNIHVGENTSTLLLNTTLYNTTFDEDAASMEYSTVSPLTANMTLQENITRVSPSDEYFRLALMGVGPEHNITNIGQVRWHICLCLLLAWILVVAFVSRGIRSTGKVAYFTATFPYVMLTVLVVRGVTLEGATKGILYFVTPDFNKLKDPEVWFAAATQLFYSTNLAWGGMITMASYNSFNHNCYRDAIMINIVSFFTSIYAGFAVFSIIGYMASESNREVQDIIDSGPGLAFIVYPRALSLMPLAPMWSALFFFMLFLLGVGSQMVIVETVLTGLVDEFPKLGINACARVLTACVVAVLFFLIGLPMSTQMVQVETIITGIVDAFPQFAKTWQRRLSTVIAVACLGGFLGLPMTTQMVDLETVMTGIMDEVPNKYKTGLYRFLILCVVSACMFLLGIPQVCQGGMYVLQLMDHYSAGFCTLVIAIFECIVINWVYGLPRFKANIKEILGYNPAVWWTICWKFISPLLILGVLIFSFVKYTPAKYGSYTYPAWADGIGWCMAMAAVMPIFIVAIVQLITAPGATLYEKYKYAIKPKISIETHSEPLKTHVTIDIGADSKADQANEASQHLMVDNHHSEKDAAMNNSSV